MNVLSKPNIFAAANKIGDAQLIEEVAAWYKKALRKDWNSPIDVHSDFPSADLVCKCLVFNLLHNRYRLICKVDFEAHMLMFKHLLTHKEYDRNEWKKDCKCK